MATCMQNKATWHLQLGLFECAGHALEIDSARLKMLLDLRQDCRVRQPNRPESESGQMRLLSGPQMQI